MFVVHVNYPFLGLLDSRESCKVTYLGEEGLNHYLVESEDIDSSMFLEEPSWFTWAPSIKEMLKYKPE